jgi:hypothetical protein
VVLWIEESTAKALRAQRGAKKRRISEAGRRKRNAEEDAKKRSEVGSRRKTR